MSSEEVRRLVRRAQADLDAAVDHLSQAARALSPESTALGELLDSARACAGVRRSLDRFAGLEAQP